MTSRLSVILLGLVAIGMASFLLLHFALIWIYGKFYIYESSKFVLTLETLMIVVTLGFSAYSVIKEAQRTKQ